MNQRTNEDRLPPHNLEYESVVNGAMLIDYKVAYPVASGLIGPDLDAFYDLKHRIVYETISRMIENGKTPVNIVTVSGQLRLDGHLEGMGGLPYLTRLQDSCPSPSGVEYFASEMIELHRRRKLIKVHTDSVARLYEGAGSEEIIESVHRSIIDLSRTRTEQKGMKQLVYESLEEIEQSHEHQGMINGLGTGFADLDRMTSGFHPGEMIVIAARPSMGKTSLAMNIAEHVAVELKQPVGVFSLEMTARSLVLRMLCSRARVNLRNIRDGFLAERDFPKITGAAIKLAAAPIYIDDSSGLTIFDVRMRARRMHQQHGIKLFVLDYLQLLSAERNRNENREQTVAAQSTGCKQIAKEFEVPFIVLSQLNRNTEKERRKPRLSDLRESGAIENDADVVAMLYRPTSDDEDHAESDAAPVNLFIAKQRNGPVGDVPLTFLKGYTRFESAAKIEREATPRHPDY